MGAFEAYIIYHTGKVEMQSIRMDNGTYPQVLKVMSPKQPMYYRNASESATLDLDVTKLYFHKLFGFALDYAYWPESWLDDWGVDSLLDFEDRSPIDRERWRREYYNQFIQENTQDTYILEGEKNASRLLSISE
ncbi:hypothetical protein PBI_COUNT_111 [Microbacterium phage Count]|nr:hypothetical protein PBI_COUNT_111 [Microbacterium phage Count]